MNDPYIILLQEIMGQSENVKKSLEACLSGWSFKVVDAVGKSGGLAIGWLKRQIKCENLWGIQLGIGEDFFSKEANLDFSILNLYGPYQLCLQF